MARLLTDRLILRQPASEDHAALAAMHADPAVMRHVGGTPLSAEESWWRVLRTAGHWPLMGYGLFVVEDRASGRFMGLAGFATFRRGLGDRFDAWPEAAWMFVTAAQGRGIAGEAMRAAQTWFDTHIASERTVCIIDPANAPSLRLAERLGYRPTGQATYHGEPIIMLARARSE